MPCEMHVENVHCVLATRTSSGFHRIEGEREWEGEIRFFFGRRKMWTFQYFVWDLRNHKTNYKLTLLPRRLFRFLNLLMCFARFCCVCCMREFANCEWAWGLGIQSVTEECADDQNRSPQTAKIREERFVNKSRARLVKREEPRRRSATRRGANFISIIKTKAAERPLCARILTIEPNAMISLHSPSIVCNGGNGDRIFKFSPTTEHNRFRFQMSAECSGVIWKDYYYRYAHSHRAMPT